MKRHILSFIIAVGPAFVSAQDQLPPDPDVPRGQAVQATRALVRWLECDECEEGELAAVTRFGQRVVPSLIAALEQGPSPASRELLRAELVKRHAELAQVPDGPEARLAVDGVEKFVAHYMDNFEAQYRVRAAQALAAVNGPKARPALKAALARAKREDVKLAIEQSLAKLK